MTERSLAGDSHKRVMAGKTQRFTSNRFGRAPRLERLTEQHWDVHLGQMLCDANRLSHSCQRKFNEFFSFSVCLFVYRVVPIEGFGRGNASTTVLHPWRLATHPRYPPHSRLCPHLLALVLIFAPSNNVTLVSILPFYANKRIKTPSPTVISVLPHSSNFLRLESQWGRWKTGST